jgi:hypothetical protein
VDRGARLFPGLLARLVPAALDHRPDCAVPGGPLEHAQAGGADHVGATGGGGAEHMRRLGRSGAVRTLVPALVRGFEVASQAVVVLPLKVVIVVVSVSVCVHRRLP